LLITKNSAYVLSNLFAFQTLFCMCEREHLIFPGRIIQTCSIYIIENSITSSPTTCCSHANDLTWILSSGQILLSTNQPLPGFQLLQALQRNYRDVG
jgi:hypothetical protein